MFKKPEGPSEYENIEAHPQNERFDEAEFVSLSSPSNSSNLDCSKTTEKQQQTGSSSTNQFFDSSPDTFGGFIVENSQFQEDPID